MTAYAHYMPENPAMGNMDELIRNMAVQTIVCGSFRVDHELTHEKSVDATILAMAVRGRYEISYQDQHWMIHPGQMFVVPCHMPVRIVHHPDRQGIMQAKWVHLHLTVHGAIDVLGLYDLPGKLNRRQSQPMGDVIDRLIQMKHQPSGRSDAFALMFERQQCAMVLARHLIAAGKRSPQRLKQLHQSAHLVPVFSAIAQHLDKPICIDDLCRWAHLSPSRLHAVFLETTGMSPIRYVMQARITQARQQLVYTDLPISQIADHLAFVSPFHFSRVFKQIVGMSPRRYRDQNNLSLGI